MAKVLVTESNLENIAGAIRTKNGLSTQYKPGEMPTAILAIPNSYSASDEGKIVKNGDLVAQTARSSAITVNGTYDTTENDSVTVNVPSGGATLQTKTVTPGASQQVVQPDSGYDGLLAVTVNGDADLVATNIKNGVEIFGVTGTYDGGGGGGGSFTPESITPEVITSSYIDSSGRLVLNSSQWPTYRLLKFKLSNYSGYLIRVQNLHGNRNFWALYPSWTNNQSLTHVSSRVSTSGDFWFFADTSCKTGCDF